MIRPVTAKDADAIAAIYEPLVLGSHVSFETDPPGIEEIRSRMSQSHAWIVDEESGVVRGYAYAHKLHDRPAYKGSTEVSVYVAERHRAAGVGKPQRGLNDPTVPPPALLDAEGE